MYGAALNCLHGAEEMFNVLENKRLVILYRSLLKSELQVMALSLALLGDDTDIVFMSPRLGPIAPSDLQYLLDSSVLSERGCACVLSGELEVWLAHRNRKPPICWKAQS